LWAALFAILFLVLFLLAASSGDHTLRSTERTHLEAAVQFVRDRERTNGLAPSPEEFEAWTREMDLKGFRFEGNGFTLDKRCGSKPSEFCLSFSTGDGFVTYKSWQPATDKVSFDDSPLPFGFASLVAGLASAILAIWLLSSAGRAGPAGSQMKA